MGPKSDCDDFNIFCNTFVIFFGSMHIHLNQIVKASIKDTREITGMVHVEMVAMRSSKMVSLGRTVRFSRSHDTSFCDVLPLKH